MEPKHIPIKHDLDVFAARRAAREMAQGLGFSPVETTAIETAVSELATNALRHAGQGTMTLRALEGREPGLEVVCQDQGPGIPDVEAALRGIATPNLKSKIENRKSPGGLGIGLGGVKRLMDELEIESWPGKGTRITARKWTSAERRSGGAGEQGSRGAGGQGSKGAGEQGSGGAEAQGEVLSSTSAPPCAWPQDRPHLRTSAQVWDLPLPPWNVQVAVASRPATGATANGDAWLVREDDGRLLIALADGLGHGEEAAQVAQKAVACIAQQHRRSLAEIMRGCHEELQGTRGVVLGLARLDPRAGTFTYAGIGNIGIRVVGREPARPISLSGIVGYTMRRVREETFPCAPGDVIVMHTDGISERFDLQTLLRQRSDLRDLVEAIAREYGRENDDATVIAVRTKRE